MCIMLNMYRYINVHTLQKYSLWHKVLLNKVFLIITNTEKPASLFEIHPPLSGKREDT